jgi:hypothetical protein
MIPLLGGLRGLRGGEIVFVMAESLLWLRKWPINGSGKKGDVS